MEEEKSKKGLYLFIIIFLVLCLAGSGFFIYKRIYQEPKKEEPKQEENILKDEIAYLDTNDYKYTLDIYKNKSSELCLKKDEANCNEVALSIKTETNNAKLITIDLTNKFILYDDNGLKVYIVDLNKYQKINLENSYQGYNIYPNDYKDKIIGIVYQTSSQSVGYYNVISDKKMYENKYSSITQIDEKYLSSNDSTSGYLLSNDDEKILLSTKNLSSYSVKKNNEKYFFFEELNAMNTPTVGIYSNDLSIIKQVDINSELQYVVVDSYLYLVDSNKVIKYDMDGNLIEEKEYGEIKDIFDKYVVFIKNNKIMYSNVQNNEENEITEWSNNLSYNAYRFSQIDTWEKMYPNENINNNCMEILNKTNKARNKLYCIDELGLLKTYNNK